MSSIIGKFSCFLVILALLTVNKMEYILIPSNSKSETAFFLNLLKKMHKESSTLSSDKMEDLAFLSALKEAEQSAKGSLSKVKSHLSKVASGK
jgi:hypothetical protein